MSEPYDGGECPTCGSDRTGSYLARSASLQGFGARCYGHDFYELSSDAYSKLEPVIHVHGEPAEPVSDAHSPRVLQPA